MIIPLATKTFNFSQIKLNMQSIVINIIEPIINVLIKEKFNFDIDIY